jgi:hypothetical protein
MFSVSLLASQFGSGSIEGQITDSQTGLSISDVNVFLSGTTYGSSTDCEGRFVIEYILPGSYTLVISHVGYDLKTHPIQILEVESQVVKFSLIPRVIETQGIGIVAFQPTEWKKNLKRFKNLFFGETRNARECEILNPEVLDFAIDKRTGNFIASTDSVLRFENRSLGYRIHVVLEKFELDKKENHLHYWVHPRFEILKSWNKRERDKWTRLRQSTYVGSFRHFLSCLARSEVRQQGFELYRTVSKFFLGMNLTLNYDQIISEDISGLKRLEFSNYLNVIYRREKKEYRTCIKLADQFDYVLFDSLGNCHSDAWFEVSGEWGKARMADKLPFDYVCDSCKLQTRQ